MSFDPTWLFLSMIPSGVGFVLFTYGKKRQRWPHIVAGLGLMVYPYLATSTSSLAIIGLGIGLALWLTVRAGW